MERYTRPILFSKKEFEKKQEQPAKEKITIPQPQNDNEGRSIAKWFLDKAHLNKSSICKAAGMDRGNFDKYLLKGEIPDKYISSLLKIIVDYGY